MNKLYQKSELAFSLVWIIAYIVLFSAADNLSASFGVEKVITAPLCIIFTAAIALWIRRGGHAEKYGLCAFRGDARKWLYFLPLVLLASVNLWGGTELRLSLIETVLYIVSMLCVGFIEEILFRGFLFNALKKDGIKLAVIIASVTFGFGHIVNLLNGAELFGTLLQIIYACAAGFLFTVILLRGGSLVPCIVTHSVLNSLSAFARDASPAADMLSAAFLTVVSLGYAVYILKMKRGEK